MNRNANLERQGTMERDYVSIGSDAIPSVSETAVSLIGWHAAVVIARRRWRAPGTCNVMHWNEREQHCRIVVLAKLYEQFASVAPHVTEGHLGGVVDNLMIDTADLDDDDEFIRRVQRKAGELIELDQIIAQGGIA